MKWTKTPAPAGAYYWQRFTKFPDARPDVVWIYNGRVHGFSGLPTRLEEDIAQGARFMGPIHPPVEAED